MNRTYDVIVLGLGAMGSSTCRHLARRGKRVLGLEQFAIPNAMGSSHGDSRVTRLSYFEHADYVPLLLRSYELWDQLQRDADRDVWRLTGGVYMGPAEGQFIQGSLAAAEKYGLPHEPLDRAEIQRRYPPFQLLPEGYAGLYEPKAGLLLPEATVAANAELAMRDGAELHGHEPVTTWTSDGSSVRVETEQGRYEAEQLILCGGAWAARAIGDVGVPLSVSRQTMGWVWPRRPDVFELGRFPVWAMEDEIGLRYGFPLLNGRPGVKIARHFVGPTTTVETVDRGVTDTDRAEIRDLVEQTLPDAVGPILSIAICLYTNTPDGHFVIDRHPRHGNVLIACGFSGHGFKFVPVIGEIMADLAERGRTQHPIDFLSLKRFSDVA